MEIPLSQFRFPKGSDPHSIKKMLIEVGLKVAGKLDPKTAGFLKQILPYLPGKFHTDSLVIHIHGGGFVAFDSMNHQNYLNKWANEISGPIFSFDYRLAPEHPFPQALDDCWQMYNWLVDNAEEYFGIRPKKIVMVGDSAGGNLILCKMANIFTKIIIHPS